MIISILGIAGAKFDHEKCLPKKENGKILYSKAFYNASVLNKNSNSYCNSTHFLLENFDDKFVFIGTKCAIKFQKEILHKYILDKDIIFKEVEDNSLDDIFEEVFELLENYENIILDITHGFRHQPIMAIFASTLSQFLNRKDLKIIFAKEEEKNKKYSYIYLDEYIEITQLSLLLTGFIRTLNFIGVKNLTLINSQVFENFSEALLSNDIKGVEKYYKKLDKELWRLKKREDLKHLENLLDMIYKELSILRNFEHFDIYLKYFILSKMTIEKNYLIVSITYIFESLREYCSFRFENITKNIRFRNSYEKNTEVMDTVCNIKRNRKENKIQKKFKYIYEKNRSQFKRVAKVYKEVKDIRNELAHINRDKSFNDIKNQIKDIIVQIENLFADKVLENIRY